MPRRTQTTIRTADFFWPSATLILLVLTVLAIGLDVISRQVDRAGAEREQAVVAHGLKQRVSEVQQMVIPQVVWDDAVRHLDIRYDPIWATSNIGRYLTQTDGFDRVYVLDAQDHPLFAFVNGKVAPNGAFGKYASVAAPLVGRVRMEEGRRVTLPQNGTADMLGYPVQSSALVRGEGRLSIVTATLVQPDFGTVRSSRRAPIVVTAMPVDATFLQNFAKRFLLKGLRLDLSGRPAPASFARVDITDPRSSALGVLFWVPERLGGSMLRKLMLPTAAVSGWYFSHPQSQYFVVGRVTREQVEDYARRKGWTVPEAERWLAPNLDYDPE